MLLKNYIISALVYVYSLFLTAELQSHHLCVCGTSETYLELRANPARQEILITWFCHQQSSTAEQQVPGDLRLLQTALPRVKRRGQVHQYVTCCERQVSGLTMIQ